MVAASGAARSCKAAAMRSSSAAAMFCVCASLLLAACGSRPDAGLLIPTSVDVATSARQHAILVATTRARDPRPGALFGGERAQRVDFAQITVSIPPNHAQGRIEWPSSPPGDPRTDFVSKEAHYLDDEKAFVAQVNARLRSRPPGQRKVLLFVHGYNTLFAEGVYRFAQIVEDARAPAVPVHFSWASQGKLTQYVYDNNSATSARDGLERVMRLLVASDADQINILAHSMGNWVTVEALRQIRISGDVPSSRKIGAIVLAAPDIDIDVFRSQMRRIGRPKKPVFIVISRDDRALKLSSFIAGGKQRLGDFGNDKELTDLGIVVVDLTDVSSSNSVHHDKFAEIAPQLRQVLERGVGQTAAGGLGGEATGNALEILSAPAALVAAPIRMIAAD